MDSKLFEAAAVIRDEQSTNANTAQRVGTLLFSMLEEMGANVSASGVNFSATSTSVVMRATVTKSDGSTEEKSVALPICDGKTAGVMIPEVKTHIATLTEQLNALYGTVDSINISLASDKQALYNLKKQLSTGTLGEKTAVANQVNVAVPIPTEVDGAEMREFVLSAATASRAGLMPASDKKKLDGYASTFGGNTKASTKVDGLMPKEAVASVETLTTQVNDLYSTTDKINTRVANAEQKLTGYADKFVNNPVASKSANGLMPKEAVASVETLTTQVNDLYSTTDKINTRVAKTEADVKWLYEELYFYGVQFDTAVADPSLTRTGNPALHRTLPIQSKMRGCLLDDEGNVVEYLPEESWEGCTLDGSLGQVMVEIPEHYRKCITNGTKREVRISEYPLPGFHKVPKMYRSAYEATVDRTVPSTPKLASVVNTEAAFRGGNNNAAYDGTYRTFCGLPVTNISLTNFRKYARNRGAAGLNGAGWNCDTYAAQLATYWLYVIEYANLNSQKAFNAEPTSEGYKQGGLGDGVTTWDGSWGAYNGYYPVIPCGVTNSLGNRTGVVEHTVSNGDNITKKFYVPSYRGIENPFGHIWKWTDGCKCAIQSEADGGESRFYVCDDPAKYQDSNYNDYSLRGLLPRANGYVKELLFGEGGENMPALCGGSSNTYECDYFYTIIPSSGTSASGVLFGGCADGGAGAGLSYAYTSSAASSANANIGSRLCFIPEA